MAKGGARVNAGRPSTPLSEHLLRGTYRPDRHGPRSNVATMPVLPAPDWRPTAADLAELGPRARRWLDHVVTAYQLDPVEGESVLLAMRCLTRIEALEAAVASSGVLRAGGEPHVLLPALSREQRVFLSLWQSLRLGK